LRRFRTEQKLQQAALTFIVCQLLTKEENDKLRGSFKALDKDSDGFISKEELRAGFKMMYSHLSEADLNKEINRVFEKADLDGNGLIDFSEWQIACVNKESILKRDRLVEAFRHFDKVRNSTNPALGRQGKDLRKGDQSSTLKRKQEVRKRGNMEADPQRGRLGWRRIHHIP
jgi:calcium-dependent protein kinase